MNTPAHPMAPPPGPLERTLRGPLWVLLGGSAFWLLLGTLGLLASNVQLHSPGLLPERAALAFGRLRPAAVNALLYGFAIQAGLAVALWILRRTAGAPLRQPALAVLGAVFWNAGVALGTGGVLAGQSTGYEWMEMPGWAWPALWAGYAAVARAAMADRPWREPGLAECYVLAGLLWFPLGTGITRVMLDLAPARGVVQTAASFWFLGGLEQACLAPLGLGAVFYFTAQLAERRLASRALAMAGFWLLLLAGGAMGSHPSAPLPAWVNAARAAAGVLMLAPVVAAGAQWNLLLEGGLLRIRACPALLLITAGMASCLMAALMGVMQSAPPLALATEFTCYETARFVLWIHGALAFVVAGAAGIILPQIASAPGRPVAAWTRRWIIIAATGAAGVALAVLSLSFGGVLQGRAGADPEIPLAEAARSVRPFLMAASVGLGLAALAAGGACLELLLRFWTEAACVWQNWRRRAAESPWAAAESEQETPGVLAAVLGRSPALLMAGMIGAMAVSWCVLVLGPQVQLGGLMPEPAAGSGAAYPLPRPAEGRQGLAVYTAHGCVQCHTLQTRPRGTGADYERGWGQRRSVARDYLFDHPVLTGFSRTGPDLSNLSLRRASRAELYEWLRQPRHTRPESLMPAYPFLFEPGPGGGPPPETGAVPTEEARRLVAHLLSLQADTPLFEAPLAPALARPRP